VAERLRRDPAVLKRARARVDGWLATGDVHPTYARAWAALLAGPLDDLCAALVDPAEPMRALRQASPFAGALEPRTRWRLLREAT